MSTKDLESIKAAYLEDRNTANAGLALVLLGLNAEEADVIINLWREEHALTAMEIANRFNIPPQKLVLSVTAEEAREGVITFAERILTTAVRDALGSDKYVVKIEKNK